ncbi:PPOX class F420-dependent oxidoreductase [Actinospica durhamensis]|uniref:PPOX class F420-dependent oxidoreductase n=1 Tax=Actinospica durhamensis TaxID=1508375 RepID=A0A941IT15_9ACTN|nr:PPOX class F420-dependent oxidoreductase [Actinospica durhamensis]MBR7835498.1 PPOX class F420-dependent oxidoreductase [Actinospica durhamensis]
MVQISDSVEKLLQQPVFVQLGTVRPDGQPQVNPMWFIWDGEFIWFTHTSYRQKYKNIQHEPRVSVAFLDPASPYGYVEVRGVVDHIDPDPQALLYQRLSKHYDGTAVVPEDAQDRIAVAVRPTKVIDAR